MLSPFLLLLLFLPLLATGKLDDPHLLRWLFIAAIGLLSALLALRSERPAAFRSRGEMIRFANLLLIFPLLFVVLAAPDPFTALRSFAGPVAAITLAFVAARTLGPRAGFKLAPFQAAVPAVLLLADRLIREGLWPTEIAIHPREITATLGNTALVGELAMISLPFLILSLHRRSFMVATSLVIGLGGPLLWLLIVSDSRGAWLAACAGLASYLLLRVFRPEEEEGRSRKNLKLVIVGGLLFQALLLTATLTGHVDLGPRLASIVDPEHPTNRVRVELWRDAFEMGNDHRVMGVGLGRFGAEHGAYRSATEWAISGADSRVDEPHNEFMRLYAETGLLGLGLAIFLYNALLLGLILRSRRGGEDGKLAAVAASALVSLGVMSLTWGSFQHPAALFPVLLFAALAQRRRMQRGDEAPTLGRFLVLLPLAASFAILFLQTERESVAVEKRDQAEQLKQDYATTGGTIEEKARTLSELGEVGRSLVRVAGSELIPMNLRHRLLITAANLCEQREIALAELRARTTEEVDLGPLMRAAENFPEPEDVRKLAQLQLELSPHHLGTRRILSGLDRLVGRKPEAITGLEKVLEINPDEPHARLRLADYYVEGGTGLYGRAADLLQEQLSRYPKLQPVADRAYEQLARCQGAQREIDLGLATVETWVETCGEADHRRAVAGELVLHFGETDATLGRFFCDQETWRERQKRGNLHVGLAAGMPASAKVANFLAQLGRYPHDTPVIAALGETLADELRDQADMEGLKNRAIALGRCHYAYDSLFSGDNSRLGVQLRLARGKNPGSGDPYLIEILAQVRARRTEAALGALRDLLDRGFDPRRRLREFDELGDFLAVPEVQDALERP